MTLINDTDKSQIIVDLDMTNCSKPMYAIRNMPQNTRDYNKSTIQH